MRKHRAGGDAVSALRITAERIAELKRHYPRGAYSQNREHHPFGHIAYSTIDIHELIDALESAYAELDRLSAQCPQNLEEPIRAIAMSAWDHGADCGVVWCPDVDMTKRGIVPCTQEEGLQESREHFAQHGSGSPVGDFETALNKLRAAIAVLSAQAKPATESEGT